MRYKDKLSCYRFFTKKDQYFQVKLLQDVGSNPAYTRQLWKPVAAVTAKVALNLSLPHSIFAISLAATVWAGYNLSCWVTAEIVLGDDFATVRAVNDFMFHLYPAPAKYAKKRGLCEWNHVAEEGSTPIPSSLSYIPAFDRFYFRFLKSFTLSNAQTYS